MCAGLPSNSSFPWTSPQGKLLIWYSNILNEAVRCEECTLYHTQSNEHLIIQLSHPYICNSPYVTIRIDVMWPAGSLWSSLSHTFSWKRGLWSTFSANRERATNQQVWTDGWQLMETHRCSPFYRMYVQSCWCALFSIVELNWFYIECIYTLVSMFRETLMFR